MQILRQENHHITSPNSVVLLFRIGIERINRWHNITTVQPPSEAPWGDTILGNHVSPTRGYFYVDFTKIKPLQKLQSLFYLEYGSDFCLFF
jgi:hypothetical protein